MPGGGVCGRGAAVAAVVGAAVAAAVGRAARAAAMARECVLL